MTPAQHSAAIRKALKAVGLGKVEVAVWVATSVTNRADLPKGTKFVCVEACMDAPKYVDQVVQAVLITLGYKDLNSSWGYFEVKLK